MSSTYFDASLGVPNLLVANAAQTKAPNPLRMDPSRTTTLRRLYVQDITRRFELLKRKVTQLVEVEDVFGLRRDSEGHQVFNRLGSVGEFVLSTNKRWAFSTTSEQLDEFDKWLHEEFKSIVPDGSQNQYFNRYIEEGYLKGQKRAYDDVMRKGLAEGSMKGFYEGGRAEFIRHSFSNPVRIERLKTLASRTLTDLKNVESATATQIKRELTAGLVRGESPRTVARMVNKNIDTIGKNRALVIARTETIRAHADGQLDAMQELGVDEVGVMAEWSTAGDDLVCGLCQALEAVVMTIKEAEGIIPRHPNCRCVWIPANVGETGKTTTRFKDPKTGNIVKDTISQKRGKEQVQGAISDSIKAEIPKSSKRTLAEQKALTRWGGADVKVSKTRPNAPVPSGPQATKVSTKTKPQPKPISIPPKSEIKLPPKPKKKVAEKPVKTKLPSRDVVRGPDTEDYADWELAQSEKFSQESADRIKPLSAEDRDLLGHYTYEGDKIMNGYLRTGRMKIDLESLVDKDYWLNDFLEGVGTSLEEAGRKKGLSIAEDYFKKGAHRINKIIEEHGYTFKKGEYVSRGMSFNTPNERADFFAKVTKATKSGESLQIDGIVSTSYSRQYPLEFTRMGKERGVVMEIIPKKGLPLEHVADASLDEMEIILPHGKQYKVVSVQKDVKYGTTTGGRNVENVDVIQLEEI